MATVTLAYDHSRDPMSPGDLASRIATALTLTTQPNVDISPTQIIVTGTGVTTANTAAIQALVNAYTLDPVAAAFPAGNLGALQLKAKQAIDVNNTFLALAAPTNAQTLTQVQRLTREATALIKLALNDATDTAGT